VEELLKKPCQRGPSYPHELSFVMSSINVKLFCFASPLNVDNGETDVTLCYFQWNLLLSYQLRSNMRT
jgi:hypothetical protein